MTAPFWQRPPADRGRINIDDPGELRWWCGRLGCTDMKLKEAVQAVGATTTRVAQYLREKRLFMVRD